MSTTPALGGLVSQLSEKREHIRLLNKELKVLSAEKTEMELAIMAQLDALGLEQTRNDVATVTISKSIVPNVLNWDLYYKFIADESAFYLLERRPSAAAWRELLEAREGEEIPGTEPFTKRTLSLRNR